MSRYARPKSGEWVTPIRRGYKFACCDCGLVHRMALRLMKNDHGPGLKIQFRAERDARATGQMRRHMKKTLSRRRGKE